ncbi:MAG: hypothetical protein V4493_02850 [Pseudomonadota bacterium]
MTLLVPNNGEGDALAYYVNKSAPQDLVLKLFKNNYTPVEGSVASDFTEADFTGYSALTLTGASWAVTEGAPSHADYAQQTFSSSAGSQNQNVYGYYLVRATSGRIAHAERFADGPYNIVNNGDQVKVTPVITLD